MNKLPPELQMRRLLEGKYPFDEAEYHFTDNLDIVVTFYYDEAIPVELTYEVNYDYYPGCSQTRDDPGEPPSLDWDVPEMPQELWDIFEDLVNLDYVQQDFEDVYYEYMTD